MADLTERIAAEKENVETTLDKLNDATARSEKTHIELAAIATNLHSTYNGIENILKQVLKAHGFKISTTLNWHKDLLNQSKDLKIISEQLKKELSEYLAFRHYFRNHYGFMLEEAKLENLANNIPEVWLRFISSVETFCQTSKNISD